MIGLKQVHVVNSKTYSRVVCERRFMIAATMATFINGWMFVAAVATTGWVWARLEFKDGLTKTCYIGIWGEWVVTHVDDIKRNETWIPHFPTPPKEVVRLIRDIDLPHFYRTQALFSIIALIFIIAANGCAVYSLRFHHRYMYKRLTSGLYLFSAMSILIVIEVMVHSINKWHIEVVQLRESQDWDSSKGHDKHDYLDERTNYSYSTVIAWFVFAIYAVAAVIFIIGSRKRKGSRSATEDFEAADRQVVIGR